LLAASAGRTKLEVQELIASRFPRSEHLELMETLSAGAAGQLAPERVELASSDGAASYTDALAPERVDSIELERGAQASSPQPLGRSVRQSRGTPIAADRYLLQLTVGRATRDKLEHARNLLAHRMPGADASQVIDRALDALIAQLERRKFAATARPRRRSAQRDDSRHVPAQIRRAVWARDGGRCTFVSEAGRRCGARQRLEFDHAEPLARGGRATVANIRLRCRAHNQFAAELAYGADFMQRKREAAREPRRRRPISAAARAGAGPRRISPAADEIEMPLRNLGFSADEARRASHYCRDYSDASLENRLRRALCYLKPRASAVTAMAST
jgi:5-methylcytosine-specific restriction endonuclease McrA